MCTMCVDMYQYVHNNILTYVCVQIHTHIDVWW